MRSHPAGHFDGVFVLFFSRNEDKDGQWMYLSFVHNLVIRLIPLCLAE